MNSAGDASRRIAAQGLPTLVATLLLSGCIVGDSPPDWSGELLDSLGIRVVHNPDVGLWEAGEAWTFRDALTIGADTAELSYQFGEVTSVAVGGGGHIYVFDGMASEIRIFDDAGRHLRTVGRRGEGPGEFSQGAAGMFLMDDGRLAVPDLRNGRVGWLDQSGDFVGSAPASLEGGFPVRWDSDGQGSIVVQRRAMGFNEDEVLAAGDPLVRLGEDGSVETVVVLPKAETVRMEGATPRFTCFETEPSWDLGPSGTLRTGMTQQYRIELRDRDGSISSVLTKDVPRRRVSADDKDRYRQLMREALARVGTSDEGIERVVGRIEFGTMFPAFNRIMEGPGGTTLVQQVQELNRVQRLDLSEELSRRLGSPQWDVYDAEGFFQGTIELPARFTPMAWRDDAVYGRWLDEMDRAHVKKLLLLRGDPGPR